MLAEELRICRQFPHAAAQFLCLVKNMCRRHIPRTVQGFRKAEDQLVIQERAFDRSQDLAAVIDIQVPVTFLIQIVNDRIPDGWIQKYIRILSKSQQSGRHLGDSGDVKRHLRESRNQLFQLFDLIRIRADQDILPAGVLSTERVDEAERMHFFSRCPQGDQFFIALPVLHKDLRRMRIAVQNQLHIAGNILSRSLLPEQDVIRLRCFQLLRDKERCREGIVIHAAARSPELPDHGCRQLCTIPVQTDHSVPVDKDIPGHVILHHPFSSLIIEP